MRSLYLAGNPDQALVETGKLDLVHVQADEIRVKIVCMQMTKTNVFAAG